MSEERFHEVKLGDLAVRCSSDIKGENHVRYFKCLKCDEAYYSAKRLVEHVSIGGDGEISCHNRHAGGPKLQTLHVNTLLEEQFGLTIVQYCRRCDVTLTGLLQIREHPKQHYQQFRCVCHVCGKMFISQNGLKRHCRFQHQKEPRERSWVCDHCGAAFFDRKILQDHKTVHSTVRAFACHLCPKRFRTGSMLAQHVKTHSGERPHACSVCGQNFTRLDNLKTHMRLHTGEKPYECGRCNIAFAQLNSLNVHMKKHQKTDLRF